jgi:hypothetical protein
MPLGAERRLDDRYSGIPITRSWSDRYPRSVLCAAPPRPGCLGGGFRLVNVGHPERSFLFQVISWK